MTKKATKKAASKKASAKKAATKKQASKKKANSKRGRPTKCTPAVTAAICIRLAEGESLRAICRDRDMPGLRTVLTWVTDDEHTDFQQQYARARKAQAELMRDDMLDIADDGSLDIKHDGEGNEYVDHQVIQRDNLRVSTRKWMLARMNPERYGDKVEHDHKGGLSVSISMDTRPEGEA